MAATLHHINSFSWETQSCTHCEAVHHATVLAHKISGMVLCWKQGHIVSIGLDIWHFITNVNISQMNIQQFMPEIITCLCCLLTGNEYAWTPPVTEACPVMQMEVFLEMVEARQGQSYWYFHLPIIYLPEKFYHLSLWNLYVSFYL